MNTVWARRREELLSDCLVSPDVFNQMINRLGEFVVPYQRGLETEAGQRNVHRYLQGLLSHLPAKNAEDIATFVDVERQVMQAFILSLPEEWVRDELRRQACHVPKEVRYHTRHEQCLEMLDAWGDQLPHGWVTGDDELGRHTRFRHELRERGERYVLGVPCTTTMRDLEAQLPEYQGRGRRPKSPWQSGTSSPA